MYETEKTQIISKTCNVTNPLLWFMFAAVGKQSRDVSLGRTNTSTRCTVPV